MRRYNSFTPALPRYQGGEEEKKEKDVKGGGLFLHWQGKGIVIDPGFNFIQNLAEESLTIGNIDAVILTHGHNDHYIDLDPILTLLYQLNDLYQSNLLGMKAMYYGDYELALKYFQKGLGIDHSDSISRKGVESCINRLGPDEIKNITEDYTKDLMTEYARMIEIPPEKHFKRVDLFLARSGQKTVDSFIPLSLDQVEDIYLLNPGVKKSFPEYKFDLYPIPAKHRDLYSDTYCVGLRFELKDKAEEIVFNLGITSDTGYYDRSDQIHNRATFRGLSDEFSETNLLVTHIGSMQRYEFYWLNEPDYQKEQNLKKYLYPNHLGILGLTKLITEISPNVLELVIISEYGEEMDDIRIELTEIINNFFQNQPVFRTGDIGLKIKLERPTRIIIKGKDIDPKDVREKYDKGRVVYEKPTTP